MYQSKTMIEVVDAILCKVKEFINTSKTQIGSHLDIIIHIVTLVEEYKFLSSSGKLDTAIKVLNKIANDNSILLSESERKMLQALTDENAAAIIKNIVDLTKKVYNINKAVGLFKCFK
jgi:hypothetical protein